MAGEGGKKSDPTVPIIIGIGILLLIFVFGGCNGINLPVHTPGVNDHGYHGSHYDNGCDRHRRYRDCGGGGDNQDHDRDRGADQGRRHHPHGAETPDADGR